MVHNMNPSIHIGCVPLHVNHEPIGTSKWRMHQLTAQSIDRSSMMMTINWRRTVDPLYSGLFHGICILNQIHFAIVIGCQTTKQEIVCIYIVY